MQANQFSGHLDLPRYFDCANCGVCVAVTQRRDRRFRFCCRQCEKQYWQRKSKNNRRRNT
ncbi:hypothetical protein QG034_07375 [Kingella kingae]|uniref:hypothetical protein n=1 Tax=Kingella kingae TaxID=504 RepID=UPI000A621254|nr:hypothetical protein [Kingella kingae]MDK4526733.1 hypothetical protein [Kingella kingae]MDK4532762.1 hypothetical protein [Kingella kingae]